MSTPSLLLASLRPLPPPQGSWLAGYLQRLFRNAPADHDPVILRHRRIYILPTRRGLAFLATLGMTLLTSLNYSLSLGFAATFMLAGTARHGARAHVPQSVRHRVAAARRRRNLRRRRHALHPRAGGRGNASIRRGARGARLRPVTVDVVPDSALPVALEVLTPRRGRIVLGRITLSSEFPMGLWHAWAYVHFPLAGIAFPTPEVNPPPLPIGVFGQEDASLTHGTTRTSPDFARTSPVIRCSESLGSPWPAAPDGTRNSSRAATAEAASTSPGIRSPASLPAQKKIARLTAWVLAAERAARPFALHAPGIALAAGQGRDHRRVALTALALMPEQS
jgi:uncharacterized protein (DUF58 family)